MDKIITLTLFALVLSSCASSGVIHTGNNSLLITKKSAGGGFVSGIGAKADLYKEANEYCNKKDQEVNTIRVNTYHGIPFVRIASAELEFSCGHPDEN